MREFLPDGTFLRFATRSFFRALLRLPSGLSLGADLLFPAELRIDLRPKLCEFFSERCFSTFGRWWWNKWPGFKTWRMAEGSMEPNGQLSGNLESSQRKAVFVGVRMSRLVTGEADLVKQLPWSPAALRARP